MELLQRRKFCREFLNGYNEKLHPQIISRVFEIGLLTLKKIFNKLLFSKEELDEIIKSFSGEEYVEIFPLRTLRNKLKHQDKDILENINTNPNDKYTISEEEELRNKNLKNQMIHKHFLQNPNFTTQNKEIYPFWWWNNKEENLDDIKNVMNNNVNLTYDENDYNKQFFNNGSNNMININDSSSKEKYYPYQNYSYNNLPQISNNINIEPKNFSIKKLNPNQKGIKNIRNNQRLNNYNNRQLNQLEPNQKVNSTRPITIKTNINTNNKKENLKIKKIDNSKINQERRRKFNNMQKMPKFNERKVIKIKGEMNNYGDMNMINMTEPNNNH